MGDPGVMDDPVFLQPGEIFATGAAVRIKTILGSCVGIMIRAPQARFAAMAHCVLPEAPADDLTDLDQPARYVDKAIASMLRMAARHGATREDVEVKLFGGADVLPVSASRAGRQRHHPLLPRRQQR